MTADLQTLLATPVERLTGRDLDAVVQHEVFGMIGYKTIVDWTHKWKSCDIINWLEERFPIHAANRDERGWVYEVGRRCLPEGELDMIWCMKRSPTLPEAVCRTAILAARVLRGKRAGT